MSQQTTISKDTATMIKVLEEFSRLDTYSELFIYSVGVTCYQDGKFLDWHISRWVGDVDTDDVSAVDVAHSYLEFNISDDNDHSTMFSMIRSTINDIFDEYIYPVYKVRENVDGN